MDGTHRRALERVLILAGGGRMLVVLYGNSPDVGNRIVEPYKLYNAPSHARMLHCYQVAGRDGPGWRSVNLEHIERIVPLEVSFAPRGEYAAASDEPQDQDAPRLRLVR